MDLFTLNLAKKYAGSGGDPCGGGFATGTFTAAETITASSVTVNHNLGVIPNRFCWFVVAPTTAGLAVSDWFPIGAFYAEQGLCAIASGSSIGSANMKYAVKSYGIERLSATETSIHLGDSIYINGGAIGAGVTVRWFAWGD